MARSYGKETERRILQQWWPDYLAQEISSREEHLDGVVFHCTLKRSKRFRDVSLRIVFSTSATPELRHLWTNDIEFHIEQGVPLEIIERALARVPNEMLGPTTMAFVRQFFGPQDA
jgi:hypothetical protein